MASSLKAGSTVTVSSQCLRRIRTPYVDQATTSNALQVVRSRGGPCNSTHCRYYVGTSYKNGLGSVSGFGQGPPGGYYVVRWRLSSLGWPKVLSTGNS